MNLPIIPRSSLGKNEKNDRRTVIRDVTALCEQLKLPKSLADEAIELNSPFPLRASQSFLKQIEHGNPDDPLLQQILPRLYEDTQVEGFCSDPVEIWPVP